MGEDEVFELILQARGFTSAENKIAYFSPNYELHQADPMLLPDMDKAVERIVLAFQKSQKVVIYGDYDIDGITASTILSDSFNAFGIEHEIYIPDRFSEGYGLHIDSLKHAKEVLGADLVVTVDCGSVSFEPLDWASKNGLDVVVTDHHTVEKTMPPAIAVVNPKRTDHNYPFIEFAGVGVAYKLVQALQSRLEGLPKGAEKWLLDMVAFGSVCDIVELVDENRMLTHWGIEVLRKSKRPGVLALCEVTGIAQNSIDSMTLGFVFGPRLNAAGRMVHAQKALRLMTTKNMNEARTFAMELEKLNQDRRHDQQKIFLEASLQAEACKDPVLVLADKDWSHGINGIVASKLVERYKKPAIVMQDLGDVTKGSMRSFGEFNAVDAIRSQQEIITSGGGHAAAGGCTVPSNKFEAFKKGINDFYHGLKLSGQIEHLLPKHDLELNDLCGVSTKLCDLVQTMSPFGKGNPYPLLHIKSTTVTKMRRVGNDKSHVQISVADNSGNERHGIVFSLPENQTPAIGDLVDVWFEPQVNEFRGQRNPQLMIKRVAPSPVMG